jgi:hypothetical protein
VSSEERQGRRPLIAVYTIVRDEEDQLARWAASARDADVLLVADTGSSDATVRRARGLGVEVHEIEVKPFRYDVARNHALDLLPSEIDLCVHLDADEVLLPGWRPELEQAWRRGATRVRCNYEWRWSDREPPLRFAASRVHARHGYRWLYPVHEQITPSGAELALDANFEIQHLRDGSRPVAANLALLRTGVAERPADGRMVHLLANEARLNGLRLQATHYLRRVLALPIGRNERLHSYLMLSRLEPHQREDWTLRACSEFPERREPWLELARLHLGRGHWRAARAAAHRALAISEPADDYLANPAAWGHELEEIAVCASRRLAEHEWESHHARRVSVVAPG